MGNCQQVSDRDIVLPSNFEGVYFCDLFRVVNCQTWKKTYSNLYDYTAEPEQYVENNLTVSLEPGASCFLVKSG